jgi:hypothetical protein
MLGYLYSPNCRQRLSESLDKVQNSALRAHETEQNIHRHPRRIVAEVRLAVFSFAATHPLFRRKHLGKVREGLY